MNSNSADTIFSIDVLSFMNSSGKVSVKKIIRRARKIQSALSTMCALEFLKSYDLDADQIGNILLKKTRPCH